MPKKPPARKIKTNTPPAFQKITLPLPNFANKNVTSLLYVLLLIAAFFLGSLTTKISYLEKAKTTENQPTAQEAAAQQPPAVKVDLKAVKDVFNNKNVIKFGDANRKTLFIEVADPSCPYCHAAAGKNPELSKQMGGQFTLVSDGGTYVSPVQEMKKLVDSGEASFAYIYQNGHGSGEMAMKALYCANEQGKFWEAHDKLMTNDGYNLINNDVKNDKASSGKLATFLAEAVNGSNLQSCLESGKYDDYLAADQKLAQSLGANGTPGFFINTTNFAGAYNWNDMKTAIDSSK